MSAQTTHYFREYCHECIDVHWVEITEARRVICHGKNFFPKETPTHYTRWRNGGIDLVPRTPKSKAALEWQLAQEAREEAELAILNQEW